MARKTPFAPCVFAPHRHVEHLPDDAVIYDVSSYADPPYCMLSPMWAHGGIPVPGMPNETSDSVEGIWQGLKVIRGKTAFRLFCGKGQKRGGKPAGHQYGKKDRLLGIVEARQKIYIVAYEWMLTNRADPELLEQFITTAFESTTQYFHDVGDSGDINNADAPLAHAAVLVQYLNRICKFRVDQ